MENNFLSLIKTRRSVRAYKPQPVPSEALDAVLEAGTYAPTGGGRQSPTIIAITDPKYRQEIARLNAEVMGNNTDPYYGAPVVILVLADGSANTFVEDGSCVLENMMLAAHALGLGTVWVLAEIMGLSHKEYVTLLPKSITTAIGMGVSEELGGYVTITVAVIGVTGVLGNIFGELICKIFRITDPIARGLSIGSASHAIGTAKAMELGEIEGAMSSLAIAVAGIFTVAASSFFCNFL